MGSAEVDRNEAAAIRPAVDADFPLLARLAADDPGVVAYSAYTYWMLHAMAEDSVLVVPGPDGLVGYVVGVYQFYPDDAAMLLQIVVRSGSRRAGIGQALVREFSRRALERGARRVLLSIDPRNSVSERFFLRLAERTGWSLTAMGSTGTLGGLIPPERIWELAPQSATPPPAASPTSGRPGR